MSYNTSTNSILRVQEWLDKLCDGQVHEFSSEAPDKLAFYLRQGIFASRHHAIEPYSKLMYTFKVRPGKVICDPQAGAVLLSGVSELDSPTYRTVVNALVSHFDVILHIRDKLKTGTTEIQFNAFDGEVDRVKAWAEKNQWSVTSDRPLVLVKDQPTDEE